MDKLYHLNEEHIYYFLLQLALILLVSKSLGSLLEKFNLPALAGEIFTGVLLGATLLGRFPGVHELIFPPDDIQNMMLETVSWIGLLFLLLTTGFEVNSSNILKYGKSSLSIGVIGILVPVGIGAYIFSYLPESSWGSNANQWTFCLFLATTASISALPIAAKVLHDLEILKSELGVTILAAFVVNEILGWFLFSFVLGFISLGDANVWRLILIFVVLVGFGVLCLTKGQIALGLVIKKMRQAQIATSASILSLISVIALACGAFTQGLGVHAIMGFFLAGIVVGNNPEIREKERDIITQMIHAVFVPIFFATIALKIDFLVSMDFVLVTTFTAVAFFGKFFGAWLGAVLARSKMQDALSIGIAHTPGGAMEIIVGILALELNLISHDIFVAIVFAAVASTFATGPLLAWSVKRRKSVNIARMLLRNNIELDMKAADRWALLDELCDKIHEHQPETLHYDIKSAVIKREKIMGTGMEHSVAVPHATLANFPRPMIAFGRSIEGVEWDTRDGLPVHFVFLIITSDDDPNQLQILASIAKSMSRKNVRDKILKATSPGTVFRHMKKALSD